MPSQAPLFGSVATADRCTMKNVRVHACIKGLHACRELVDVACDTWRKEQLSRDLSNTWELSGHLQGYVMRRSMPLQLLPCQIRLNIGWGLSRRCVRRIHDV